MSSFHLEGVHDLGDHISFIRHGTRGGSGYSEQEQELLSGYNIV